MNLSPSIRRTTLLATGALAVATLLGVGATSANASSTLPATPAPSATDGWVRVAHLSADTKAVDVTVSALSGGQKLFELDDVAYGTVSSYEHFPAGTYTISMKPWSKKSSSNAKAILSASVKIVQGKSVTVAAFGKNKSLKTKVFQDNLTAPPAGDSRIRIIQASTINKSVTVTTPAGQLIAADALSGTSSSYANVTAGAWTLEVRGKSKTETTQLSLTAGSVDTLFVLDNASGGFSVRPVLDSAGVGADPVGGINTGGGWAATHDQAAVAAPAWLENTVGMTRVK